MKISRSEVYEAASRILAAKLASLPQRLDLDLQGDAEVEEDERRMAIVAIHYIDWAVKAALHLKIEVEGVRDYGDAKFDEDD